MHEGANCIEKIMEFAMVQETKPTGEDIAKKDADVFGARKRW